MFRTLYYVKDPNSPFIKKSQQGNLSLYIFLAGIQLWKCLVNVSLIKSTMPSCQQLSSEAIYSAKQCMNLNCLSVCLTHSSVPLGCFSTNHTGIAGRLNVVIFSKIKITQNKKFYVYYFGSWKVLHSRGGDTVFFSYIIDAKSIFNLKTHRTSCEKSKSLPDDIKYGNR